MQDIDFDEIDRAVNSVIDSGAPLETPERSEPPEVKREVEVPERSEPVRPAISPAARRSSGRFMDVVHPSSDMRPASASSRPAEQKTQPTPTPTPNSQPEPASLSDNKDNFKWPDPLEVGATADASQPEPAQEVTDNTSDNPLETPFLTDTKVEKRPLGAFSETKPTLDLTDVLNEDHDDTPPTPVDFSAPTADATPKEDVAVIDEAKLEASEESLIGSVESADTVPDEKTAPATEKKEEKPAASYDPPASATLGAASIPQQYKEQPSTTTQPSGAIYDTEAYHQPLAHPQKKKSGLLVIVWILALIVLGGGLGAALYFFVLPML